MDGIRLDLAACMGQAIAALLACGRHQSADQRVANRNRVACLHHRLPLERLNAFDDTLARGHYLDHSILVQLFCRRLATIRLHNQAVAPHIERQKSHVRLQLHHLPADTAEVKRADTRADMHAQFIKLLHNLCRI